MAQDHPLGIIAGGGRAPFVLIDACLSQARPFFVFCLKGQCDEKDYEAWPHEVVPMGALGVFKKTIEERGIHEIVMLGRVRRPSLLELKPDWHAARVLAKIGFSSLGDDGLLTALGKVFEEEIGVKILGAHQVFGDFLMPKGALTRKIPNDEAHSDIKRGINVIKLLGQSDVGQSIVVQQGLVLGVEAIEGTDALIVRCADLKRQGDAPILVKGAKPQQDDRFDLPTIGIDTVKSAVASGFRGIALQAGRALVVDKEATAEVADQNGLFIWGWEDEI